MRLAVFSDIHGNYQALTAIMKDIEKNNIDDIIFLGDAVGLGPDGDECLGILNKVNFVLGNHDLYCTRGYEIDKDIEEGRIKHHLWVLTTLKKNKVIDNNNIKYELNVDGKKFLFQHFFLEENNPYPYKHLDMFNTDVYKEIFANTDYDYVFYGHSHDIRYDEYNGKKFYGVGSSGCVKNNKTYYHIIDINNGLVDVKKKIVRFNRKKFDNRLANINYPEKNKLINIFFK